MRNLILVTFVEPVTEGQEFPRSDWPLHITLARFDINGADAPAGVAARADAPVRAALGTQLTVGKDDAFGYLGSIPVSLIEPSPALQLLHESLVDAVVGLSGTIASPQYTGNNYRPHVSHHGDRRAHPGDAVVLDRVALVDMAPDGGHATRRILHLWTLPEAGTDKSL
ncbi:2'-5' RNA ligase family protein [Pseudarthrobacter sp. N5]|uniref:2'-5' RNA ligase family protein n=1 Tax=Pseudarthrobacter sp. N5 TaxID=3418416 RepID=UPI003CEFC08E